MALRALLVCPYLAATDGRSALLLGYWPFESFQTEYREYPLRIGSSTTGMTGVPGHEDAEARR